MRKLVDAPRKKKQWTEKEEAYLQDKWGTVSIKGLSKALGRSENAIIVRAQRLGAARTCRRHKDIPEPAHACNLRKEHARLHQRQADPVRTAGQMAM